MRSKVKYMAIVAIVVVAVLAITLVSCGGGKVAEETTKWLASAEKAIVTDTITLSDVKLNVGGTGILNGDIITIKSLDIVATRVIEGDKLGLTLEVKNIKDLAFGGAIDTLLKSVGGMLEEAGINIKNIGNIGSIQLKLNYDPSQDIVLTGEFHGYGLNAFISNMPEGDSNPKGETFINVEKTAVTGNDHKKEVELISNIMDLLDNPIYGPTTFDKKGSGTSNVANIVALANKALELYGEEKIWDSNGNKTQYDAKTLVNMIFGAGKADSIADVFADVLSISSLKLANSETQKVGGKNVYKSTELTANVDVEISAAVLKNITSNIGKILGALGVTLPDIVSSLLPNLLNGNAALEASVNVSTSYVNG